LVDVKVGDVLADIDGAPARVLSKTPVRIADDMYKITFIDNYGRLTNVKAAGTHVWPLDRASYWIDDKGNTVTECDSKTLSEWYLDGRRAVLAPMKGSEDVISWTVYSCYPTDDSTVQCITVDSPTHTFLLADENADQVIVDQSMLSVMEHSVPTHNCGGPLSLDTVVSLYDGGSTTMGEVMVGDVLIGPGGDRTTVLGTSDVMQAEDMWEIEFEGV
jgi:hypothetical protein